jgi:hypothetical protein
MPLRDEPLPNRSEDHFFKPDRPNSPGLIGELYCTAASQIGPLKWLVALKIPIRSTVGFWLQVQPSKPGRLNSPGLYRRIVLNRSRRRRRGSVAGEPLARKTERARASMPQSTRALIVRCESPLS